MAVTTTNRSSPTPLTLALAAWSSVALTTYAVRLYRRRRNRRREELVAGDGRNGGGSGRLGGLMSQVRNAVEALEWRATSADSAQRDSIALVGAAATAAAGDGTDGISYTWAEYYEAVQKFAIALVESAPPPPPPGVGRTKGGGGAAAAAATHGVAIHAFNEPRWFVAALGALAAGWTVSGIYLTNTYVQAAHVLRTSEVRVLVLESEELLRTTYRTVLADFPALKVVLLSGGGDGARTVSFSAFVESSSGGANAHLEKLSHKLTPPKDLPADAVASLVYTSGTTGNPKAVELTHSSITSVCAMMHARIPLSDRTVVVSYLPLSHIAAMGIDLYSSLFCGATVHFADKDALRGSLKDTLLRVRPTLFFGVPRVWEKMAGAMQASAAKSYAKRGSGKVLKAIGTAAKAVGGAWWDADTSELVRCGMLAVPFGMFKALVYRKVRRGCGLDRCELLYTGAAPLPGETLRYLRSVDMPLLEVFGMSESAGAIAVCGPNDGARPAGACGRALPNGELEIAPDDGEVLWRGANNMRGYKGLSRETEAALNPRTGQLHTGDVGKVDDAGYLYITGRKKDLIITAGGENVAPTPIEGVIKSLLGDDVAGHVVLIGDRRKFLTILIAPPEGRGPAAVPVSADVVEAAVGTYNATHAKSRAQRVQKAHVLEEPFGVSTGELTPTMKLKRSFVTDKFKAEIDAMYADGASGLMGYTSVNIGKIETAMA